MPDINSVPGEARGTVQVQGGSANAGEAQVSRQGSTTVSRRASQICEFISTYALGYGLGSTLNEGVWSGTRSRCFGGQRLGGPPQTPIRMFEQRCSFNVATLFTLYLSRSITYNIHITNTHTDPMSPPPLPLASPQSPSLTGSVPSFDAAGVPMRHPRPLTAAELHLELEKEQEAVVNRLTRELSALRAHSASVASTTSSVTSGMHEDMMLGATHPTAARRHRSSSSVSRSGVVGMLTLAF